MFIKLVSRSDAVVQLKAWIHDWCH
jgi:hypothetical protein